MNRTPNQRENSRARRRPTSVNRTPHPQNGYPDNGYTAPRHQPEPDNAYRFQAGSPRRTVHPSRQAEQAKTASRRPMSPQAVQNGNTGVVEASGWKRQLAKAEAFWQKDVVRVQGGPDLFMLGLILLLFALGTVMVFSSSYPLAIKEGKNSNYYIANQIKFLLMGGAAMAFVTFLPIRFWKKWAPPIAYAVSSVLLLYTAVAGMAEGVTKRWISVFGLFNLQPSELMKISLVLMLAWYAEKAGKRMHELDRGVFSYWWNTIVPCLILGPACVLVLIGKHLSGTIIVGLIGYFTLLIAGSKFWWLTGTIFPFAAGGLALFLEKNAYALKRITTKMDDNANILSDAWQTTQSVYAIGSGGLFGVGLGQSRQKYSYLGNAHTDFIFSIWCEELGFIAAVVLILLFLLFIWRGYVIAVRAPDTFTMLTAFGITTHVGLQAFLNMAVASDIIMNTGVTLPFFSYGGSSTIVLMAEMGILLSISRRSYKKKNDLEREQMRIRAGLD
ncbi:MAG: cell division protein FtsW [Clostridia bacterium]|nr:cell division protein FtsW [Clostridia bacterium]